MQVPQGAEDRANTATCDATTRKCTASFTLDDGGGALQVQSLSAPTIVRAGVAKPGAITVTHAGFQKLVAVGAPTPAGVPAAGTWTLEEDLASGEEPTPPPRLQVHVDFGCP